MTMTLFETELAEVERARLDELETKIDAGLQTFMDVSLALIEIRDNRLYREINHTFEGYCRERWGFSSSRARQLIAAAEVAQNLESVTSGNTTLLSERSIRPLVRLDPGQQREVYQDAIATAPNGKVTAAHIEATARRFVPPVAPDEDEQFLDETAGNANGYDWTDQSLPINIEDQYGHVETSHTNGSVPASKLAIHFSSDTPEHYTPGSILDLVVEVMGKIDLDPCSNSKEDPAVPAINHYTVEDDGLELPWNGTVYMNPPYGRIIGDWVEKLVSEFETGNTTEAIALVPARVDTEWWNNLTSCSRTIPLVCFVRGRLTFINNDNPAPFPSALVYLGDNRTEFYAAFSTIGKIWAQWDDELAGLVDYGSA